MELEAASIVEVPVPAAVARPPAAIVATFWSKDDQPTDAVRFCVLPSLYFPVAVNCCDVPLRIVGFAGVTEIDVRLGVPEEVYVNPLAKLPLCPLTVTVTVTAPALPAGVVAVIWVPLTTATFVAAVPPNVTAAPAAKFVPVIVTAIPPAVEPLFGDTLLTVGGVVTPVGVRKATICMIHSPDGLAGAVAL
jgi:hypothetical protein